jgi:hypothetical protein
METVQRPPTAAHMRIGDLVTHLGRALILRGLEPMSMPVRHAEVEDPETGQRFYVPFDELEEAPPRPGGLDPAT